MKNGFIFYKSFHDALGILPDKERLALYDTITAYAFGEELPKIAGATLACWLLIKPQIDANAERYENGKRGAEFGKLGGRPRKNPIGVIDENPSGVIEETPKYKEKEKEKVKEKDIYSAVVCGIPLNNGTEYRPTTDELNEYISLYPNVDVIAEFNKMRGWCLGNPTRRKTARGVKRFITGWLAKEQDRPQRKTQILPAYKTAEIDDTAGTAEQQGAIQALLDQMKGQA